MQLLQRRPALINLGLLMLSLGISLVLLEAVLRQVDPPFYSGHRRYHPDLGWVLPPNSVQYPVRGERRIRFEANELGFRDVSHPPWSVPGVRRIVVIGDSFTEAAQVELAETFGSVLQKLLNRGGSEYWQVVHLAVGGYGTVQELVALENYGLRYAPDLIILQIFPFNDVINNSLSGAYVANPHDTYRPYLDPATGYRSLTYLNPRTNWLRRKSALLRQLFLVSNRYFGAWGREEYLDSDEDRQAFIAQRFPIDGVPPQRLKQAIMMNSLAPPGQQMAVIRDGWAATEAAIRRIGAIARAEEAKFMALVIPHVRLLDGSLQDLRSRVPYRIDQRYPEERISAVLADSAVPVIELADVFENNLEVVLPIPAGHLNRATHALMAEILLPEVEKLMGPD